MTDLSEFLLARIAEDEAAARAATPGRWKLWGMSVLADQDGTSNVDTAVGVAHTAYRDEHGKPRTWDAFHMTRWDPARALAECDAKRRIVESCHVDYEDSLTGGDDGMTLAEEVLRALALPYADCPDYREEWSA